MLILFFDTYIVSGVGDAGGSIQSKQSANSLGKIRNTLPLYYWQTKLDVVKYTLASYAEIAWDQVVIRFECEDTSDTNDFYVYCRSLFPFAQIENERSSTALAYLMALKKVKASENDWVFFSPNNDHPFLANPSDLTNFIAAADNFLIHYPQVTARLLVSHYTESINDYSFSSPQYGYYAGIFKRLIYKDNQIIVTASNKVCNDSVMLFRLGFLLEIFSLTKNSGRVIRIEDTEFYIYPDSQSLLICPTRELCRHYDSYEHIMDFVPPLFIPSGFFENNIRVRYGYNDYKAGWINVNPLKFFVGVDCDLWNLLDDLPHFWLSRISVLDINKKMPPLPDKASLYAYKKFNNPWHSRPFVVNIIRSCFIRLSRPVRILIRCVTILLRPFYSKFKRIIPINLFF